MKLSSSFGLSVAEYALYDGSHVSIEQFLGWFDVGRDDEGDALSACPLRVRAAIVYHFLWQNTLFSQDRAVAQLAFAHEAANSTATANFGVDTFRVLGEGGTTSTVRNIGVRSAGIGYVNKFLNALARHTFGRQLRGPNANKLDFNNPPAGVHRVGADPSGVIGGPVGGADHFAGQIAEVNHNYTDYLTKYYVRPKASLVRAFADAVRPLFYPRLHHGFHWLSQNPTALHTGIEFPKSRKQRSRIPIALHHAMEEVVQLSQLGTMVENLWWALHMDRGEAIGVEIANFKKAREEYAYGVLCKQANLPEALAQYDGFAEIGYLTPRVMPRRQVLDHGTICFPGMNGERVAEQQKQEAK